jgi:molybdopterin molybdotransferase
MAEQRLSPQRIDKLTPLASTLAAIDRLAALVAPYECAIDAALGKTLAADAIVHEARPSVALALRDGWAVRSEETLDAGSYAPAPLVTPPVEVAAGEPLPPGFDAVAPLDAVTMSGTAQALAAVAPGEGVLPTAADAKPDSVLRQAGRKLRASEVSALRALGMARISIRAPHVRVVRARPGDTVLDIAADWIVAAAAADGAIAMSYGWLGDDAKHLHGALVAKLTDAIIVVGGTGTGRNDSSVETLRRVGRVEMHGIALAPGQTTALGMIGTTPVLLVPGRLDAAVAAYVTLGRRMLARLAGQGNDVDPSVPAVLTRKVASRLGMTEVVPVRRNAEGVEPLAADYLPHAALAQADGYILVPADSEGYPAGASVAVRPMP